MNRIYTKTGDDGTTGVFGGPRLSKDDVRIEAYGTVDELNAILGVAITQQPAERLHEWLLSIQHELFSVGAELATPDPDAHGMRSIFAEQVDRLAEAIDELETELPPLQNFILPGGSPLASTLHLARTVCRRAERRVVTLSKTSAVAQELIHYLNRLSDLLFVMARYTNDRGQGDVLWSK